MSSLILAYAPAAKSFVECPANYDTSLITDEDIEHDRQIRRLDEMDIEEECGLFDLSAINAITAAGLGIDDLAASTGADVGVGGYSGTIGYKIANGDLTPAAAAEWLRSR